MIWLIVEKAQKTSEHWEKFLYMIMEAENSEPDDLGHFLEVWLCDNFCAMSLRGLKNSSISK